MGLSWPLEDETNDRELIWGLVFEAPGNTNSFLLELGSYALQITQPWNIVLGEPWAWSAPAAIISV